MALFKRDEPTNVIPPAGSQVEVKHTNRPGWLILLAAAVVILIISTGLVFAGRWIYRSVHHKSSTSVSQPTGGSKKPSSQSAPSPQSSTSPTSPSKPSPQPSGGSASKPTPQPALPSSGSSNKPTSPSPTASTQTLPQNGPGDMAALFIGTSLAAAGLHYLIRMRRQES